MCSPTRNPVFGLKQGGVFIISRNVTDADAAWARIPVQAQRFIIENDIRMFFIGRIPDRPRRGLQRTAVPLCRATPSRARSLRHRC